MTARNTHAPAKAALGKTASRLGLAGRSGTLARPRPLRSALGIAAALLLGVVPLPGASASASAGANPATGTPAAAPNPQQIDALVRIILATLQADSGHGSAQDLEGRLTFAIDQAQANCSVTQAALVDVQAMSGALSPVARQASRRRPSCSSCWSLSPLPLRCRTRGSAGSATRPRR